MNLSRSINPAMPLLLALLLALQCSILVDVSHSQTSKDEIAEIFRTNPAQAIRLAEKFTAEASPETASLEQAKVLELLARQYARRGMIGKSSERIGLAREICIQRRFHKTLSRVYQLESVNAQVRGNFQDGVQAADNALKLLDETDTFRPICLNERATNLASLNRFEESIRDFSDAFELAIKNRNQRVALMCLVNQSNVFGMIGDIDKSIEVNKRALSIAAALKSHRVHAMALSHLGSDHLTLAQKSLGEDNGHQIPTDKKEMIDDYFRKSLKIAEPRQYREIKAMCYTGLADLAVLELELETAKSLFKKALVEYQRLFDLPGIAQTNTRLIAVKNLTRTRVDAEVILELEQNLETEIEKKNFRIASSIADELARSFTKNGDHRNASQVLQQRLALQEKLHGFQVSAAIDRNGTATPQHFVTLESIRPSSHEIGELEQMIQHRNLLIFVTLLLSAGISLALVVLWRRKHSVDRKLKQANVSIRQEEQKTVLMESHLAQEEKIESLSTMSAGVMHDFNNYLSAIIGGAELGISCAEPGLKNQQLETVIDTAICAAELTKGLSNYLGSGCMKFEKLKADDLLLPIQSVLNSFTDSDLNFELDEDIRDTRLFADINALRSVVINIVKNAVEACEDRQDRKITIRLSNFKVGLKKYLQITVTDNGPGMSEKIASRAMDPFFSTKSVGRGLGLASSKGIIKSHDGDLSIHTSAGHGTEIRIELPHDQSLKSPAEPSPKKQPATETPEALSRQQRVLYVDDDELVLRAMCSLLSKGYKTETAGTAEEAWEMIEHGDTPFDCVVTDFLLPGMNGLELAAKIKGRNPDCSIIMVSGYMEPKFPKTKTIDLFLRKPFTHATLVSNMVTLTRKPDSRDAPGESSDEFPVQP
ncbi:MAG: ATP-binding protein [Planctomycetota bacterium]|nr:ATP-binding protein [Planctomycetota bacterium]